MKDVPTERIIEIVCKAAGVSHEEMMGPLKDQRIFAARHISIVLVKKLKHASNPELASIFESSKAYIATALRQFESRIRRDCYFRHLYIECFDRISMEAWGVKDLEDVA